MSIVFPCPKCRGMSYTSVFMIPGERVPDDVQLRRFLADQGLEKVYEEPGYEEACGRCLLDRARELGLTDKTAEQVLSPEVRAPDMEIQIFR